MFNFDASNVEPERNDFLPVPAGEYEVFIEKTEVKKTSDGCGELLVLQFSILRGNYDKRKLFDRFMIKHIRTDEKMKTALDIAKSKLSSICRAINTMQIEQVGSAVPALHNKPLKVGVGVKFSEFKGENENILKYFKGCNETSFGTPSVPPSSGMPAHIQNAPPNNPQAPPFIEDDIPF